MDKPGVVLQRPVGSNKPFMENAELPTAASLDLEPRKVEAAKKKEKAPEVRKTDELAARRAAAAFEKERARRERKREREETAAAKAREKRQAAMDKAEAALAGAKQEHEERVAEMAMDLAARAAPTSKKSAGRS